ncbi:DNA primase domain containing protein [Aphelenchoides bicaudatus]|nr:DNA primase domain containing protein [Aphelenchoides bicaudatus]
MKRAFSAMSGPVYHPELLNEYLRPYYGQLYPAKLICKWLSYGNVPKDYMERREIAFIFEGDRHHRYQTFKLPVELQSELSKKCPQKIDIGAVYNVPTKLYKSVPVFKPVERELVFDIDLTDYDNVRSCCSAANVCDKCWKFIIIAARVLNVILTKHFGFKHLLWIFSGRRGMHCWVADKEARKLENNDRSALAAYLTFHLNELPFDENYTHPFAEDVFRAILDSPEIDDLVMEQKWLEDESFAVIVANYCPEEKNRKFLLSIIKQTNETSRRWRLIKKFCDKAANQGDTDAKGVNIYAEMFLRSFLLDRLNPRLDANVTTSTNHLLKSPFCVHPKTGSIAVPFSLESIADFRLEDVPRIDKLVRELGDLQNRMEVDEPSENRKVLAYKHTSLKPWIEVFEKFIDDLLADKTPQVHV